MVRFLEIEHVYNLHRDILTRAGTAGGVRDFALLHSAVERPKAMFGGKYLYPNIYAMAAAILQSICLNHAFTDGNKRTAWAATKLFLWMNGLNLKAKALDGADFIVYVDNHKPDIQHITNWIKKHCT